VLRFALAEKSHKPSLRGVVLLVGT